MGLELLAIGLFVGVIGGMLGVGGGVLLVPALYYLLGFPQHEAQGTSIAVLVPPIGLFAALEYYRHGYVRVGVVAWVALGFALGAFLGAVLAGHLPAAALRRLFGLLLFFVSLQMLFAPPGRQIGAVWPTVAATAAAGALSWIDRRVGVGARLGRRLSRWAQRRRPPTRLDDDVEYHI